jgi:hypothetical protein
MCLKQALSGTKLFSQFKMATNITWHDGNVSKEERATLLGQKVSLG